MDLSPLRLRPLSPGTSGQALSSQVCHGPLGAWLCLGSGTCGVWTHLELTDIRYFPKVTQQEVAELEFCPCVLCSLHHT